MKAAIVLLLLAAGCADDPAPASACGARGERLVVTADWLERTLTLIDVARLTNEACTIDEAIVGTVDLAGHPPGPIEVELTPDGTRAVVAVGPGFLAGNIVNADDVAPGGEVLVVDLASRSVIHAIDMPEPPMGLAISPDGTRALSANYGTADAAGSTLSLIDLEAGSVIADYATGGRPEQVALDASGTRGLINAASDDTVSSFAVGDVVTLSMPIGVATDPSDVVFVRDDLAVVTSSIAMSYGLIDVGDPSAPLLLGEYPTGHGVPYGVALVAGTTEIVLTSFLAEATVARIDVGGAAPEELAAIALEGSAFTLGAAVDAEGRYAFVPQPNDRRLSIVDFETGSARSVTWLDGHGPTWVAIGP